MSDYTTKGRAPAFQFYPGDYLKDPAVRAVSLAARGLWMDMLCLMHESPQRGYLQHQSGLAVSPEQLSRMVGSNAREVNKLLAELEGSGVFSRTETERIIYSRRMVRDNRKTELCREAGSRGGNPQLKAGLNGTLKGGLKQDPNPKITPSSSSSSSDNPLPPNRPDAPHRPDAVDAKPLPRSFTIHGYTVRMEKSMYDDLAARMYKQHAKKDGKILFEQALAMVLAGAQDGAEALALKIESRHGAWCKYWRTTCSGPQFWPPLAKWIADGKFEDDLPSTADDSDEPELVNIDPAEAARRSVIEYQQFIRDRDRDRKQQAAS